VCYVSFCSLLPPLALLLSFFTKTAASNSCLARPVCRLVKTWPRPARTPPTPPPPTPTMHLQVSIKLANRSIENLCYTDLQWIYFYTAKTSFSVIFVWVLSRKRERKKNKNLPGHFDGLGLDQLPLGTGNKFFIN